MRVPRCEGAPAKTAQFGDVIKSDGRAADLTWIIGLAFLAVNYGVEAFPFFIVRAYRTRGATSFAPVGQQAKPSPSGAGVSRSTAPSDGGGQGANRVAVALSGAILWLLFGGTVGATIDAMARHETPFLGMLLPIATALAAGSALLALCRVVTDHVANGEKRQFWRHVFSVSIVVLGLFLAISLALPKQ